LVGEPSDIDVDYYSVTSSPQTDVGCYVIITYWCSLLRHHHIWCSLLHHHIL